MLQRFRGGNPEALAKLNAIVDELNSISGLKGDSFINVVRGPGGAMATLNIQALLARIPKLLAAASIHPAKVATTPTGELFTANLYDNGYAAAATDSGVSVSLLNTSATLTVSQEILVFEDQSGNYWYEGAAAGGVSTVNYARAADSALASTMDGVGLSNGDQVLKISGSGAGVYTYNSAGGGSFTALASQPNAVIVGHEGTSYGGLTFTGNSGGFTAGGYAWA